MLLSDVHLIMRNAVGRFNATKWAGILIFGLTFFVFRISPVRQVTDSQYSMMLSQSLLDHRSFMLDHYALPRPELVRWEDYLRKSYQLEVVAGHLFYSFPPGSSVLLRALCGLHESFRYLRRQRRWDA